MQSKALPAGSVIKGLKHTYKIESILQSDGQGFTYRTLTPVERNGKTEMVFTVLREHILTRCSGRGADGITVETPEDIIPTVESCLDSFIFSSQEREKISKASPWVINVIETFKANNTYYYAVEFLGGETLYEYVERMGGRLTYEQTREVLSPIFDAVRTMHRFRALHTNIHPGHIRFKSSQSKQNVPILFSLYSSLHFSDTGIQRWTLPLMTCATSYAPPEQYFEIDHFAPQIDIYALASTMVYALSGKALPDSRHITEEDIRALIPADVPENVTLALINALDPDMSKRTATITKFREELGYFLSLQEPHQRNGLETSNDEDSDNTFFGKLTRLFRRNNKE